MIVSVISGKKLTLETRLLHYIRKYDGLAKESTNKASTQDDPDEIKVCLKIAAEYESLINIYSRSLKATLMNAESHGLAIHVDEAENIWRGKPCNIAEDQQ